MIQTNFAQVNLAEVAKCDDADKKIEALKHLLVNAHCAGKKLANEMNKIDALRGEEVEAKLSPHLEALAKSVSYSLYILGINSESLVASSMSEVQLPSDIEAN